MNTWVKVSLTKSLCKSLHLAPRCILLCLVELLGSQSQDEEEEYPCILGMDALVRQPKVSKCLVHFHTEKLLWALKDKNW